jgi:hypothetical protein
MEQILCGMERFYMLPYLLVCFNCLGTLHRTIIIRSTVKDPVSESQATTLHYETRTQKVTFFISFPTLLPQLSFYTNMKKISS